jgi:hypothetical protein|eukprot:COSAG06_NODE_48032_length_335_cov_0.652542_1_plen_42_part_00
MRAKGTPDESFGQNAVAAGRLGLLWLDVSFLLNLSARTLAL